MAEHRILTPSEYEALRKNTPKYSHRLIIDSLLFTGARYSELKWVFANLTSFDPINRAIKLPGKATKTKKARVIHLTPTYTKTLDDFVRSGQELKIPDQVSMNRNLKRWSNVIERPPTVKTFRKTWESWLLFVGFHSMPVALSQGHKEIISYDHYANLDPRLKSEVDKVKRYTEGWMQ